jgi:hypothetical protein
LTQANLHQPTVDQGFPERTPPSTCGSGWVTFEKMLLRLHKEGMYLHPEQLAEFLLFHGIPVHLRYVPSHLKQRAIAINENYQGDMVQLIDEWDETP